MGVEEFGDRLGRLRTRAGLTQDQLAAKARISFQTIQSWEGKKSTVTPRRANVIKVARALNPDPDEIDKLLALLDHEPLDDEERTEEFDEDKQRFDVLWLRLTHGQRHCLVEFMESMTGGRPPNNVSDWGTPVEPGSGRVPPPRNDDPTDDV